jgi:hypothetical protein
MAGTRVSRRGFVKTGVAAAVAGGVALEHGSLQASTSRESDLLVGHFVRAVGAQSGVVRLIEGGEVLVRLDSAAFLAHGAEGVVESVVVFVPGEEVVVRGIVHGGEVAATELQSVYTSATGTLSLGSDGRFLPTAHGRIRISREIFESAHPPADVGSECTATIWTNPLTGAATAVDLAGS